MPKASLLKNFVNFADEKLTYLQKVSIDREIFFENNREEISKIIEMKYPKSLIVEYLMDLYTNRECQNRLTQSYYISLGNNCEVGMLMKKWGYDNSSFFRYTYSPPSSILKIIQNEFKDIYLFENIIPNTDTLVRDTKNNISFHSKQKSLIDPDSKQRLFIHTEDERIKIFASEKSKISYLIDKWRYQIQDNKHIYYFIKDTNLLGEDFLQKLIDALKNIGNDNFDLVYLSLKKWENKVRRYEKIDKLKIAYLNFYAPNSNVISCDEDSYKGIFEKFGLNEYLDSKKYFEEQVQNISS